MTAVLREPQVGAWLAHCLRQLRAAPVPAPSDDVEHLGEVAVSAWIRSGLDLDAAMALRDPATVAVPGIGVLHVDAHRKATVRVSQHGGELFLDDCPVWSFTEEKVWSTPRRISARAPDGLAIDLVLDDIDPFRDCEDLGHSDRLSSAEVDEWQLLLTDAWTILCTHHRRYAEAISAGLTAIVPLVNDGVARGMSATSRDAFGSTSMTRPFDAAGMAVSLVHEFQHAKLSALLDIVGLYDLADDRLYYAPWRDDPRPLGGLLQGAYAFLGVADFWRVHRFVSAGSNDFAHFEFARWRERLARVLDGTVRVG